MDAVDSESEELAALAALLEANGHSSTGNASAVAAGIIRLEMFLQDYPKMIALHYFRSLTDLRLIDQRIEKIEGLQGCPHLKKLWLIENRISVIENLDLCTALQELYLTSNRISEINGLDQLTDLQVLWAADNYISRIAGINKLLSLQQLNLARNDIAVLGSSLQHNSRLTSLNLADNRISSLQDVVNGASSLSSLQELCLADPLWGECPVVHLSNYQTFILAQIPQLTNLDTLVLAQETTAAAATTFGRKQLYYSMRLRTLRRSLINLCHRATAAHQMQASSWLKTYAELAHAAKRLQQQLQSCEGAAADGQQLQLGDLLDAMQAVIQHLESQQAAVSRDCCRAQAGLQAATSRLHLQLTSAGNIWLQEGCHSDAWVQSCQGLLGNNCLCQHGPGRTSQQDTTLQVLNASRIHNRNLQVQFARQWQSGKDCEYLFFSDPTADIYSIIQHGFSSAHGSWEADAAIPLSSFLDTAGVPEVDQGDSGTGVMQTLVCKVSLHGTCKVLEKDVLLQAGGCQAQRAGQPHQYAGLQAVYSNIHSSRAGNTQRQHRHWLVFDHTAVLPEYLVTWCVKGACGSEQTLGNHGTVPGPSSSDPLLQLCTQPLNRWLHAAAQGQTPVGGQQDEDQGASERSLRSRCAAALAAVHAPPCPQLHLLTPAALSSAIGGKQLQSLTHLCLQDCGCTSFDRLLHHLPSLAVLALPFNKLTSLGGLSTPASGHALVELDVSHNQLTTWCSSWLLGCSRLTALDVAFNLISDPDHLHNMAKSVQQLQQLSLRFNPVQQHKAYFVSLAALTRLSKLDGQQVHKAEESKAAPCITPALLHDSSTRWHGATGPVQALPTLGTGDWRELLHSVVLDGLGLRSLHGLAAAPNLVSASFADNLIVDLSELADCSKLRQLNVSSNLISELGPLLRLHSLQQLDVSDNQLSCDLLSLSELTAMTHLSCEHNSISNLAGINNLSNLVELYAAHNGIADIKEAEQLSSLPRLAVLDLVGNPCVGALQDYRLLLLFRLTHLKVLDGVPASTAELAAAQEQHAGRLTLTMLEEHVGSGCVLSSLRHLDLSAVGLKDLGAAVFAAEGPLAALTGLVLDNNNLTNLEPLSGLTRLVLLSINNNKGYEGSSSTSFCFGVPTSELCQGVQKLTQAPRPMLPNLQTLQLAGCGMTSLVPLCLQCLPALRSVFVQGNELSTLDGLEGLLQLRELVADRNRIRVLEPALLSSCIRLQELRLEENLIRCISSCNGVSGGLSACLPSLQVLQLGGNRLADATDCAQQLASLPCLLEAGVAGNPFARKQGYRRLLISHCSQLQVLDGQQVSHEEREAVAALAGVDSPRCSSDAPQYTAAMLLAAAAATADARSSPVVLPSARAAPNNSCGMLLERPKAVAQGPPTTLGYEGMASITAARQVLLGLGPALLPGILPTSVPSIQSGVLVLTGPASFGLEGTSMRGSSTATNVSGVGSSVSASGSPNTVAGKRLPQQQHQSSPLSTASGSSRRMTTGSIASYRAGGFAVRQATFEH